MKRFTETDKWADPWFMSLEPLFKLTWLHICDACDSVGVVDLNKPLVEFQMGASIDWLGFMTVCGERIKEMKNGKLWIRAFCKFQHPDLDLESKSNTSKAYIKLLKKHRLWEDYLETTGSLQGKGKGKRKGKEGGKGETKVSQQDVNRIYELFPKKAARPEAEKAITKAVQRHGFDHVLTKTTEFTAACDRPLQFIPNPATFFNQDRFNDDPKTWKDENHKRTPAASVDRNADNSNAAAVDSYAGR